MCAVISSQRPANPEGSKVAGARWIERQLRAHDGTTRIRHVHTNPAWALAEAGLPIYHCTTWPRADSATVGDPLRTSRGAMSCTGTRAAAHRRTPAESAYDVRRRCVQGSWSSVSTSTRPVWPARSQSGTPRAFPTIMGFRATRARRRPSGSGRRTRGLLWRCAVPLRCVADSRRFRVLSIAAMLCRTLMSCRALAFVL